MSMAESAGVEIINLSKAGSYKKVFLNDSVSLDTEWQPITESEKDDIAVISVAGNEMIGKRSHYNSNGKCHVSNPKMLSDEQAKLLARDVERIVQIVRTNFHGKIVVFGPTPRHIESCCSQLRHSLLDAEGKELDMIKYTNGVTELLLHSISFPVNCEFVGYKEMFGGEFVAEMLSDGVHLDETLILTLSGFIMSLLSRKPTPALPAMANVASFSSILVRNGVKAVAASEDQMEQADG